MQLTTRILAALIAVAVVAAVAVIVLRPNHSIPPSTTPAGSFTTAPAKQPATVWALGDSADGAAASRQVAKLIADAAPDQFLYLGDVYESGTADEFARNYEPVFGRLQRITLPTPGNHDWPNHEEGYNPYWAEVSGAIRPPDHYSVELAGWQLLSLNSEAPHDASSEQARWLQRELASGGNCRIAFWHRPRYSAGSHGDQPDMAPLWDRLAGRAKIVVNGHEHNMQRLHPIDGITTLISGAGGDSSYEVSPDYRQLAFADTEHLGALQLQLQPGRAEWEFVAVDGRILDRGELNCDGPVGSESG